MKRNCPKCNKELIYNKKSNYNRSVKANSLCRSCADETRRGVKRTPEQCERISKATKIAMNTPEIKQKVIEGMSKPEVKEKMSNNTKKQMALLKLDMGKYKKQVEIIRERDIIRWKEMDELERKNQLTKIWNGRKDFWENPLNKKKQSDRMSGKNNPFYGKNHPKELMDKIREKQSITMSFRVSTGIFDPKNNNFKHGYYTSILTGINEFYSSSYELVRMKQLDESGIIWTKKHKIRIPYVNKLGQKRNYVPDFLVNNTILEEVKPKSLVDKDNNPEKMLAAREYCKNNNLEYKVLTEKDLGIKI